MRAAPGLLFLLAVAASAISQVPRIPKSRDWPYVSPHSAPDWHSPVIVIGILGGMIKHDDPIRREVKLAEHLRAEYPSRLYVETFENRHQKKAMHAILKHLDADGKGAALSINEARSARVILYGHSLGGAAVVQIARELQKRGIPVLLTIQVDSVARVGSGDAVVPSNVARAVNFYQPNGAIHGRAEIRAEDPSKTEIIGNYRFDYKAHPVDCPEYPWYERAFAKTHTEIACDPNVWNQVEALIDQQIGPRAAP